MSIARRTIASFGWQFGATPLQLAVMLGRSILLARWLPIAAFGVFTKGAAIVGLTVMVAGFGMSTGLLNRVAETEDEDRAAAVLFTLRLGFGLAWLAVLVAAAVLWAAADLRLVLIVMASTTFVKQMADTPRRILTRRVVHRRVALADTAAVLLSSIGAVATAWWSPTVWALLVPEIVTAAVLTVAFFGWRPVWRPRLELDRAVVRYYLGYGSRNFPSVLLARAIDRVDDLWTGFALGDAALGFYSRAYRFATYSRSVIAAPVNAVALGTYAELKHDRDGLSRAFFRINAILIRSAFLLMGALAIAAPELITIALTPKWLPMLTTFRLMLVFALLDPIVVTMAGMLVATGRPEQVLNSRALQFGTLCLGLLLLGPRLGVAGVALSVDVMAVVGIVALLAHSRRYVDLSISALWVAPSIALVAAAAAVWLALKALPASAGDWPVLLVKSLIYASVFVATLLLIERERSRRLLGFARAHLALRSGGHHS